MANGLTYEKITFIFSADALQISTDGRQSLGNVFAVSTEPVGKNVFEFEVSVSNLIHREQFM
jgi:hypothetical protein